MRIIQSAPLGWSVRFFYCRFDCDGQVLLTTLSFHLQRSLQYMSYSFSALWDIQSKMIHKCNFIFKKDYITPGSIHFMSAQISVTNLIIQLQCLLKHSIIIAVQIVTLVFILIIEFGCIFQIHFNLSTQIRQNHILVRWVFFNKCKMMATMQITKYNLKKVLITN